MGRKTDILNDEKQQLSSNISRMSSDSIEHESQTNSNRNFYETKMDDNDPLIHDTILPHRKRIRKDPLQYVQPPQSHPNVDVSFILFLFINNNKKSKLNLP